MLNNRLLSRTAHSPSRGGFTLVELLVVIGIIAILAGVALGPITNGIKKAKQSAGLQQAHAIGLAMYSFANDNNQLYPDTSNPSGNPGTGAAAVAGPLISGGYVTDPSIFYISGGAATKYTGTIASAASTIQATNISWDFAGQGGPGVSSTTVPFLPIAWSTIVNGTEVNISGGATLNTAITGKPSVGNPFGTAGMAVFYANNSAAFITANVQGVCTLVTGPNNAGGLPSGGTTLNGGG